MKCARCGKTPVVAIGNYDYRECGLDYVTLVKVRVLHCSECGTRGVSLPRIEELHRVLARAVARAPWHLDGAEIRFLRKYLGFSGADFARAMGKAPETISRWEHGRAEMTEACERFLRLLVFNQTPAESYPPEELAQLPKTSARKSQLRIRPSSHDGWEPAPKAAHG